MKFEEWLSQQDGVIEVDCGCVTTEAFYHWMRVAYEAGNSPAHSGLRQEQSGVYPAQDGNSPAQDGNSPVIPDGYMMVPKEPTERMVIDGFESEPDETFSEPEVWEAFQKMSGCEQAAFRARLCWAAMLAAAPQEVKGG